MIKCIKIDVDIKRIHEVEINDNIQDIYKQLQCDTFEVVGIDDFNDLYVDEEGLMKVNEESKFFMIDGYKQPLVGHGLIFGHDRSGNSTSTTFSVDEVRKRITFLTYKDVKYMEHYSE